MARQQLTHDPPATYRLTFSDPALAEPLTYVVNHKVVASTVEVSEDGLGLSIILELAERESGRVYDTPQVQRHHYSMRPIAEWGNIDVKVSGGGTDGSRMFMRVPDQGGRYRSISNDDIARLPPEVPGLSWEVFAHTLGLPVWVAQAIYTQEQAAQ